MTLLRLQVSLIVTARYRALPASIVSARFRGLPILVCTLPNQSAFLPKRYWLKGLGTETTGYNVPCLLICGLSPHSSYKCVLHQRRLAWGRLLEEREEPLGIL